MEDRDSALARTDAFWREWSGRCTYDGEYRDEVLTSLIALKAMTDEITGAVVAAPTTSLPEDLGGVRNWDYRYCWLRDSVLTLNSLIAGGYTDEAIAFRDFAFRAGTGDPSKLQIMYGVGGERQLDEFDSTGFRATRTRAPCGWATLHLANSSWIRRGRRCRGRGGGEARSPRSAQLGALAGVGRARRASVARARRRNLGGARAAQALHPIQVMAWVVFDTALRIAERFGLDAPVERWKQIRQEIHDEVCEKGYDAERGTFTQYYGSEELDAAALAVARVGFLPGSDRRVTGTINAIRDGLGHDGFISRYSTAETDDGLPGSEGQFLACSLARYHVGIERAARRGARAVERLLGLTNDLGLLAEEYDVARQRQVGKLPPGIQPPGAHRRCGCNHHSGLNSVAKGPGSAAPTGEGTRHNAGSR